MENLFTKLSVNGLLTNYLLYPGLQQITGTGDHALMNITRFQMNQYIITHLPQFIRYIIDNIRFTIQNVFTPKELPITSSIDFVYINEPNCKSNTIESILDYICKKDETIFLKYTDTDNYKPYHNKTFKVSENISVRIKESHYLEDGKLQSLSFQLFSTVLSLDTLKRWVKEIDRSHIKEDSVLSSVEFTYLSDSHKNDDLVDSVIDFICQENETIFLKYTNDFKPSNHKEFKVTDTIKAKILSSAYSEDGKLETFSFRIYSTVIKLDSLRKWVSDINELYQAEKENQLCNKRYFFREIATPPPKDYDGNYRLETSRRNLIFTMSEFETNKSLKNIFGPSIHEIKKRIDLFNNVEWYKLRGLPRTLGLLLHGIPGTGKTSVIKAIAKDTNRHVISVKLSNYTTQEQLNQLFYKETLEVNDGIKNETFKIPLKQRIYVFEDIDCLSDIVLERSTIETKKQQEQQQPSVTQGIPVLHQVKSISSLMGTDIDKIDNAPNDQNGDGMGIDLNFLLNLFDGILETPGRLMIMTTNHPEKLDKALVRPGRIDLNIKFDKMTHEYIQEMFEYFYQDRCADRGEALQDMIRLYTFDEKFDDKFTPAQLIQILGVHYADPDKAYDVLHRMLTLSRF